MLTALMDSRIAPLPVTVLITYTALFEIMKVNDRVLFGIYSILSGQILDEINRIYRLSDNSKSCGK